MHSLKIVCHQHSVCIAGELTREQAVTAAEGGGEHAGGVRHVGQLLPTAAQPMHRHRAVHHQGVLRGYPTTHPSTFITLK